MASESAPWVPALRRRLTSDPGAFAAWGLSFALVCYLALRGGAYDPILRGQVGVILWWLVLLGAGARLLPTGAARVQWTAIALLAGLTAWTALGISGSESVERSTGELSRLVTYLGALVLIVLGLSSHRARNLLGGVATAIALVAGLAVLSRLHPSWFPDSEANALLPGARNRLGYPINYSNALSALVAMGVPLVLAAAVSARSALARSLSAAALPVMVLCCYLTLSRGGAVAGGIAVLVFMAWAPDRLSVLVTAAVAAGGGALLIAAAAARAQLAAGLATPAAQHQGTEVLLLALAVAAVAGVAQQLITAGLKRRPAWTRFSRRRASVITAVVVPAAAVALLAAGAVGFAGDRWGDFKRTESAPATASRFGSAAGNLRYQYWVSASDAFATDPWRGIGAQSFEFWWARHATTYSVVRDAHSLYMQTLAELGIPGLALLGGFLLWILGAGGRRTLRAPPGDRTMLAGALASAVAFCASAAVEWIWQIPVLPVALILLAGALLSGPRRRLRGRSSVALRAGLVAAAIAALVVIAIPMATASYVRRSEAQGQRGHLQAALSDARTAERIQPAAASPRLQESLVLEALGRFAAATERARASVRAERTNWRTWLILSRIEAEAGRPRQAVQTYRIARSLNPRLPLFAASRG